jgi:hypothetical protein
MLEICKHVGVAVAVILLSREIGAFILSFGQ